MKIQEAKVPELKPGEVLVRNTFTCLCASDLHTFHGRRIEKSPTILGHEIAGIVDKVSDAWEVKDERGKVIKVGDTITWAIYASDPLGALAQKGIPQKSDVTCKYGHELLSDENTLHGGLATHTIIRENTPIVVIEKPLPHKLIAIINCSVATVAGAYRLAGSVEGKKILVSGAGMLGVVACAMGTTLGAQVFVSDIDTERVQTSLLFGAKPYAASEKYDIVLEFSGANQAMESSMNQLQIGGTAVWVGATFSQENLSISAEKLIRNLHTIKGLHNYNAVDLKHAVTFMETFAERFPFASLIHSGFGLEEVNDAFSFARQNKVYRTGIYY